MTVAKLIELLKTCDPNRIVIMSSDPEGNSYSPCSGFCEGSYQAESDCRGEVYLKGDSIQDGEPCVVLSPTG